VRRTVRRLVRAIGVGRLMAADGVGSLIR